MYIRNTLDDTFFTLVDKYTDLSNELCKSVNNCTNCLLDFVNRNIEKQNQNYVDINIISNINAYDESVSVIFIGWLKYIPASEFNPKPYRTLSANIKIVGSKNGKFSDLDIEYNDIIKDAEITESNSAIVPIMCNRIFDIFCKALYKDIGTIKTNHDFDELKKLPIDIKTTLKNDLLLVKDNISKLNDGHLTYSNAINYSGTCYDGSLKGMKTYEFTWKVRVYCDTASKYYVHAISIEGESSEEKDPKTYLEEVFYNSTDTMHYASKTILLDKVIDALSDDTNKEG